VSDQVSNVHVKQYATNVAMLLQQKDSRFTPAVMHGTYVGEQAQVVTQVGAVNARRKMTRFEDSPVIATPHDSRWAHPADYDWGDFVSKYDVIRMLTDIKSPYAEAGRMALARAKDDEIISAFHGAAFSGKEGTTSNTWAAFVAANAAHQIIVATGITITLLRRAKMALMEAEVDVDNDTLYCGLTAEQHAQLLNETQATSLDYNTKPTLVDGRITQFMGFNFIQSQRLAGVGTANCRLPVWAKSGMHLGTWNDIETKTTERGDKSFDWYVYVAGTFGAVRLEDKKFVELQVADNLL
jgi:hypothetical protein